MADSIPIPPAPMEYKTEKKKKGLFELFSRKGNSSTLDKPLEKVTEESLPSAYSSDFKSMDISNPLAQTPAHSEAIFKEPQASSDKENPAGKEIVMDDLEGLEQELSNLDKKVAEQENKVELSEPEQKMEDDFQLPDIDQPSAPPDLTKEEPKLSIEEPPKEQPVPMQPEKALDAPSEDISIQPEIVSSPELKQILSEDEFEEPENMPEPKLEQVALKTQSTGDGAQIVSKVPPIRQRGNVEQHFKSLEQDHRKINEQIVKAVKSGEEPTNPEHFFVLKNGRTVKNLSELIKALKTIDEATFQHHVSGGKNDFANWINDILKKEELADEIRNKKAKEELLKLLSNHVKEIDESIVNYKKDQLSIIERVKKARDSLYKLQQEVDAREQDLAKREAIISKSKAFDVDGYKKKMQEYYNQKEKNLLKSINQQKQKIEADRKQLGEQEKSIATREKNLAALQAKAKNELASYQEKQNRIKDAETKVNKQLSDLQKREQALKSKEDSYSKREDSLNAKEKELNAKEQKIQNILEADQNLKKSLEGLDQKIAEERSQIEQQGFSQYLKEELAKSYPEHVTQVSNINGALDIPQNQTDIEVMITEARKLLNQNKVKDAQLAYNKIKEEFAKKKLPHKDKEALYHKVIELYDDIHLALMQ